MQNSGSQPRTRCATCAIRERAICAYCSPEDLKRLDAIKSYKVYAKGSTIVTAGERSPFVGSIVNGVVALSQTLMDGRAQIVGLQFPSDFLGGAFRETAPCDAIAASEVLLCQFERAAFDALMRDLPTLRARLLDITITELDASRDWLTLLGQKTAREKLSSFLLMLLRRANPTPDDAVVVELPLTRAEIGRFLGLTIETVSRQLSSLRAAGLIQLEDHRRVMVLDAAALAAEAGEAAAATVVKDVASGSR
ncbi:MAG: Crp/Fnr family transcriptional regulator [Pseudomonadota bacterium]